MNSILLQHKETIKRNQLVLDKFIAENSNISNVTRRRLMQGIGISNANYVTRKIINGEQVYCNFYTTWKGMISRCYSEKYQKRQPTYKGCTVCKEWHSFMAFKSWMETQDYKGKQLDKDLLFIGNKIYSPETCLFVSHSVNNLMSRNDAIRGLYPQGVHCVKGKYRASVYIDNKSNGIGTFKTAKEAESAYIKAKTANIMRVALEQTDKKVMNALINQASHMVANLKSLI